MLYPPLLPDLLACDGDSGLHLEEVHGARCDLLRWYSQSTDGIVELPVYLDAWLSAKTCASVEQVIVHIHGRERDRSVAWADVAAARSRLPVEQQGRTLIVVPHFLNGLDKPKFQSSDRPRPPNLLVWKANGWGEGSASVHPNPSARGSDGGVSSFEALDAIFSHFTHRQMYASIKRIVFSGHSMGGQLVHRYAILGSPPLAPHQPVAEIDHVVMNPASYLYFDPNRPGPPANEMNVYKYGFEQIRAKIPTYGEIQRSRNQGRKFYLNRLLRERSVHFLHGAADRGVGDDRPEAMAQGADRHERAVNYHRHLEQMEARFGIATRLWTVDWVPNVKHDGRAMTTSNAAIARIFSSQHGRS